MGGDTAIVEDCFRYPDQWRRTVRCGSDGAESMVFVLNGNSNWARSSGKKVRAMPLPPPNMRTPAILDTLGRLAALRESKEDMVIGPREEITGQTLIPLTIMVGGRPLSTTYFDRSTNLVVNEAKYDLPAVRDPPEAWKKHGSMETETTYGDYKSFDGVMVPTHMVASQAGKAVLDVSVLRVEFSPKSDASTFDRPRDE